MDSMPAIGGRRGRGRVVDSLPARGGSRRGHGKLTCMRVWEGRGGGMDSSFLQEGGWSGQLACEGACGTPDMRLT